MKILLFHCKHIGFQDVRKSKRPKGIVPNSKVSQEFSDTLAAFICVEAWDKPEYTTEAINIILSHLKLVKKNRVIIVPFAHLSYYLAPFELATSVLDDISRDLKSRKIEVGRSFFGYHKKFEMSLSDLSVPGHPGSVAYRRIPNDVKIELQNIVQEEGLEKVYEALKKIKKERGVGKGE